MDSGSSRWACGKRLLSALRRHTSGSSGAQILEVKTWKYCGGRGRGRQRVVKELQKNYDGDVISDVDKNIGGKGGDAEKEICVKGFVGSSKVCGGCSVVRVDLLGQWWRRGSAELDGRLEVPNR